MTRELEEVVNNLRIYPDRTRANGFNFFARMVVLVVAVGAAGIVARAETKAPVLLEGSSGVTIQVLGVAQDAGHPQIYCYEPRCLSAWEQGTQRLGATALALIVKDASFFMFDAPPELPRALYEIWRSSQLQLSDLKGIFLTHAHMGHYAGMLHLGKEAAGAANVPVFAMPRMKRFLESNGPWSQLVTDKNIKIHPLVADQPVLIDPVTVTPWRVPHRDEYSETVGFFIEGPAKSALYLPDIDQWHRWDRRLIDVIQQVDYAFIDATFFGAGELPGRDMSLVPHPTVQSTMLLLQKLAPELRSRVIFIHMNNTNLMLDVASPQAKAVIQKGFNIARVGARFDL